MNDRSEALKLKFTELLNWVELCGQRGAEPRLSSEEELEAWIELARGRLMELLNKTDDCSLEPDDLNTIREKRPSGGRKLADALPGIPRFFDRLRGAILGRCAGCVLGAPVELWSMERIKIFAKVIGEAHPPVDYWSRVADPETIHCTHDYRYLFERGQMKHVPVDDDLAYMLVNLFVLERFGANYSTANIAAVWDELLPVAYTAEKKALENYRNGVDVIDCGGKDNPYVDWIGAWIRSDTWGYVAAGWPEKAAELAWRDAMLSHRKSGVYGAMFFSAAIAAAFTVDDPLEAIRIGLTEIPANCRFAEAIHWALARCDDLKDFEYARCMVDDRFAGMSHVHAENNACLVVFGLALGGMDFTKTIGQTVAMGMDNDCTAATAGSILGAIVGSKGIERKWTKPFEGRMRTYLNGVPLLDIEDVCKRMMVQAELVWQEVG
ncbi:ADP-ribosylglycohydrolase family protein [Poriferisphaera sp. WC338]|uniref:ADP-ribosylglycohydrolase family protein n=1 Tax=Poriferisphaera sp. WC338 TaxID=3425129 RepID=UPI003D81960C